MDELSILRARDRTTTSWPNGGGHTSEVIVSPAGADFATFNWRVSVASIRANGPFSHLPGIDRQLVVLEGPLTLEVSGQAIAKMSPTSAPVAWSGDLPTYGRVLAGPVAALNVMTRRGRCRATLERRSLASPVSVHNTSLCTVVLVTSLVSIEYCGVQHRLQPRDAVLLRGESAVGLTAGPAPAVYYVVEIADEPALG